MGQKKQVIQYKDGIQINIFDSATEAAKALNTIKSNISKCCNGKLLNFNGYTFKYTGKITNKQLNNKPVKCPYCEKTFENYNGLCKHIFKELQHGKNITREQLLTDYKYKGKRPKCKCGCGEYTTIIYTNGAHFSDYVQGHHNRVHNNWGHNENAKKKSAETRRKQYSEGTRKQWNKGKKWEETYTQEQIDSLLESRRQYIFRKMTNEEFHLSSEIEKEFINTCIVPLNLKFKTQYYIKEINHYCDVYIEEKNTIIEFQGDFWHGNPDIYTDQKNLKKYQKDKNEKDVILRQFCEKQNINLIEVWEKCYRKNKENIFQILKNCFNETNKNEIYEYCKTLYPSTEQSNKSIIKPYELDIYIPEINTAIEYNGLLWHSDKYKVDKNYHLKKLNACKEKGIKLLQIFEDEYINNKNIVFEKIKHILKKCENLPKIMGRKCEIKEIKSDIAKEFLTKYHIQGFVNSTIYIGSYYENKLIGVMTFKQEHDKKKWELTRFASNYNYICQGIGGKLFKYFIRKYNPNEIKSFADRRWTIDEENNIYLQLGFKFDSYTLPDYKYFKTSDGIIRQHKFGFRKERLHKKYGLPMTMTEKEMTKKLGYSKIYDCGLIKYIWVK